jgi:methanogenic corrinoid protein MtbC1
MADATQHLAATGYCGDLAEIPDSAIWHPKARKAAIRSGPLQGVSKLVRAIETEIIPRLILARREDGAELRGVTVAPQGIKPANVEEFTAIVLRQDATYAVTFIDAMRAQGVSVEQVYLSLLTPTARRLGDLWVSDLVDFTQVTIGVGRLQQVLRYYSPEFVEELDSPQLGRRVLLLPAPYEQHSFGLIMVAEFFRRAGWEVWSDTAQANQDVVLLVGHQAFAVAGFSLSSAERIDGLAAQIRAVRRASMNRSIGVLVGGQVFIDHPELVALIGADATATDGKQAVTRAEDMLALLAISC